MNALIWLFKVSHQETKISRPWSLRLTLEDESAQLQTFNDREPGGNNDECLPIKTDANFILQFYTQAFFYIHSSIISVLTFRAQ